jgi:hypothetical protein
MISTYDSNKPMFQFPYAYVDDMNLKEYLASSSLSQFNIIIIYDSSTKHVAEAETNQILENFVPCHKVGLAV